MATLQLDKDTLQFLDDCLSAIKKVVKEWKNKKAHEDCLTSIGAQLSKGGK